MKSARNWSLVAIVTFAALVGCSKKEEPARVASATPAAPDAAEVHAERTAEPGDALHGKLTAAGIPTTYAAHFENGQLTRISEQRPAGATGEYRYYGARVTHYSGAPLGPGASVDIEFDLQGAVQSSKRADGAAAQLTAEEIASIQTRAQLLRSHAMTQRSVQTH